MYKVAQYSRMSQHRASYRKPGWNITVGTTDSIYFQAVALALAVTYGAAVASLPLEVFADRVYYLNYAANSWSILRRYWSASPLVGLANEPLWLLLNAGLATWLSPETIVRAIIAVPAAVVAWLVLQHDRRQFAWLLLFLFFPQVIVHHINQLRQGVAIAVFLVAWCTPRRWLYLVCLAATPFIHASFFLILLLVTSTHIVRRLRLGTGPQVLLFALVGVAVGISLDWVASALGARQAAHYGGSVEGVSGLGFLFWSGVLGLMYLQGRSYVRRYTFETGVVVFYLSTYFLIDVTARVFESAVLFILLVGLQLTNWRRNVFLALIVAYFAILYSLRVDQPWLGFGVS